MEPTRRVWSGPVLTEGTILRSVTDGTTVWSEVWSPERRAFVKGATIADVMVGRRLSPDELAARGIPTTV